MVSVSHYFLLGTMLVSVVRTFDVKMNQTARPSVDDNSINSRWTPKQSVKVVPSKVPIKSATSSAPKRVLPSSSLIGARSATVVHHLKHNVPVDLYSPCTVIYEMYEGPVDKHHYEHVGDEETNGDDIDEWIRKEFTSQTNRSENGSKQSSGRHDIGVQLVREMAHKTNYLKSLTTNIIKKVTKFLICSNFLNFNVFLQNLFEECHSIPVDQPIISFPSITNVNMI